MMDERPEDPTPEPPEALPVPPAEPAGPVGHPWVSWVVIALMVVGAVGLHRLRSARGGAGGEGAREERLGLIIETMQARYLVGASHLLRRLLPPGGHEGVPLAREAAALNTGPPDNRLRYITVAGELGGPDAALRELSALDRKLVLRGLRLTPSQSEVADLLDRLYTDLKDGKPETPSVTEDDRHLLRERLGWFGKLALAPAGGPNPAERDEVLGSATRTALTVIAALVGVGVFGLAGAGGLCLLFLGWGSGTLRGGLGEAAPHSGVYAETFAIWMVVFLLLSLGSMFVPAPGSQLLVTGLAMLLSLLVLAWPVLRGVPWRRVRQDLGLTWGRQPLREVAAGGACYVMAIPLLVVGLALTLFFLGLRGGLRLPAAQLAGDEFSSRGLPVHPILEDIVRGGAWGVAQIYFVACVAAPVVEETMFRGALYRQLRDGSRGLGAALSFLVSALLVNFVFAVVHPQGLVAVPALMGLALGLTLAREWRGTLLPSMVAHGLNNGLLMTLVLLALGGS